MKRSLMAAFAAAVALSTLGVSIGGADATTPAIGRDPAPPAAKTTWKKIATTGIVNTVVPSLARAVDGRVHIVHQYDASSTADFYAQVIATPTGKIVGRAPILGPWAVLRRDPTILPAPTGGLYLSFSGLSGGATGDFYADGYGYYATADATGATWTTQPAATTKSKSYASTGSSAVLLADGTPVTSGAQIGGIWWRVGTIPSAVAPIAPEDNLIPWAKCCPYETALARSGDEVYLAWYSNADDQNGIYVQRILPTAGPIQKAPRSSTSSGQSIDPGQAVSMVARPGGGVVLGYCVGYPTCKYLGEWEIGTTKVHKVPESKGATSMALGTGPSGRLWTTWIDPNDDVRGVRTSPRGFDYGGVASGSHPKNEDVLYHVSVEGSRSRADVVVNAGDALYYRQLQAGLTLKASPSTWRAGRRTSVTFRVRDAGDKIKNAKVRAGGRNCKTKGSGKCTITFPGLSPRRFTATASKNGYGDDTVKLRVRR